MAGKIYPRKTYLLRIHVGEAKDPEDGKKYAMSQNTMSGEPIVESGQTGKWFVLSWPEIIDMARRAGIDTAEEA